MPNYCLYLLGFVCFVNNLWIFWWFPNLVTFWEPPLPIPETSKWIFKQFDTDKLHFLGINIQKHSKLVLHIKYSICSPTVIFHRLQMSVCLIHYTWNTIFKNLRKQLLFVENNLEGLIHLQEVIKMAMENLIRLLYDI